MKRDFVIFIATMAYIAACTIVLAFQTDAKYKQLADRPCKIDHHEYQIELEFDTVLIYDNNRFVGSYIVTTPLSPIDSILADDNR